MGPFAFFWTKRGSIPPEESLLHCPRRFTPWLVSPFCSSIGTGPPQVSLLLFPVCFPRVSSSFLASGFLCSCSPHPLSRLVTISGFIPFLRVPLQYGLLVRLCFPPYGFGSVFPSFPRCFSFLPCVRSYPHRFYCRLLVHRRFDCSPFTFRIPVLPLRHCGFGCCGPRVCRSAPTPLPRSGKVNRASGSK